MTKDFDPTAQSIADALNSAKQISPPSYGEEQLSLDEAYSVERTKGLGR